MKKIVKDKSRFTVPVLELRLYTLTSGLTMLYLHVTLRDVNRNKSMYRNSKSVRLAKI